MFSLFVIDYFAKVCGKKDIYFVGIPFIQVNDISEDVMQFMNNPKHRKALKLLVDLGLTWSKKKICLQDSACKFFMSSGEKNDGLINRVYSKEFEVDNWEEMCKIIKIYTKLQSFVSNNNKG